MAAHIQGGISILGAMALCCAVSVFSAEVKKNINPSITQLKSSAPSDKELNEAKDELDDNSDEENAKKAIETLNSFSKNKDKRVSHEAKATLARYYRKAGDIQKARNIVKNCADISSLKKELGTDGGTAFLNCFLEAALTDAATGETTPALKSLAFAETSTKGIDKALTLSAYAEAMIILNKPENAKVYLDDATKLCKETFKKLGEISTGEAKADVSGERTAWMRLQSDVWALQTEYEGAMLERQFGPEYADYFRMLSAYKKKRYIRALALSEKIIKEAEKSVYGDAAKYYRALCVLKQKCDKKDRDAKIKKAESLLKKFIDENPNGLYRGEAMIELGRIAIEEHWDTRKSSQYYSEALEYFRKQREMKDTMQLYAVPEKVREVSMPKGKLTGLNEWNRIVFRDPDAKEIINQQTAPAWYISQKEKEAIFFLGFFLYLDGNFGEAKKCWSEIGNLDTDLAALNAKDIPNVIYRLISASEVERMLFPVEERKYLKNKNKLYCAYAELNYLLEHFEESRHFWNEILSNSQSSDIEKAMAYIGIGATWAVERKPGKNLDNEMSSFQKAMDLAGKTEVYGNAITRLAMMYQGVWGWGDKSLKYNEEYIKIFPKGRYREQNEYLRIRVYYYYLDKKHKALELFDTFAKKYPESNYVKTLKYVFDTDKKQGGKK